MSAKQVKFDVSYFLICFGGKKSGVYKKISDQISVWEDEGLNFQVCAITDINSAQDWKSICKNTQVMIDKKSIYRFIYRALQMWKISRQTHETLYLRELAPLPFLRIVRNNVWILELQTIQENEIRERSKFKSFIYRRFLKTWFLNFDGFICVSNEIRNELKTNFADKKTEVISNGIRLDGFETLPIKNLGPNPNFFFIGDLNQSWQGADQILEFSSQLPYCNFHLVGPYSFDEKVSQNVFLHGPLKSEEYMQIAELCDVAFGTLNQQSTGMHEASPLKVREYLRWGLPVVGRYTDTDFSDSEDFFLKLPNSAAPLSDFKKEIETFAMNWKGRRVSSQNVSTLIDSKIKEASRLDFFESFRESSPKS